MEGRALASGCKASPPRQEPGRPHGPRIRSCFSIRLFRMPVDQNLNKGLSMNDKTLQRRDLGRLVLAGALLFSAAFAFVQPARAADEAPDALVKRLSTDVLETIKADSSIKSGDINRSWEWSTQDHAQRQLPAHDGLGRRPGLARSHAGAAQRLQEEFKTLLVRTYAGALVAGVGRDHHHARRSRLAHRHRRRGAHRGPGRGDPVQLEYRLEKTPGQGAGWKVYNLNVLGVWLVDTYRTQFSQEVNKSGVALGRGAPARCRHQLPRDQRQNGGIERHDQPRQPMAAIRNGTAIGWSWTGRRDRGGAGDDDPIASCRPQQGPVGGAGRRAAPQRRARVRAVGAATECCRPQRRHRAPVRPH